MVAVVKGNGESPIVKPGEILVTIRLDRQTRSVSITGPHDPVVTLKVIMEGARTVLDKVLALRTQRGLPGI